MIRAYEIPDLLPTTQALDYKQQTDEIEMDYGVLFLRALREAIPNVSAEYFKCSNVNRRRAEDYSNNAKLIKTAFSYGERAFCYELYHQLRISLDTLLKNNPEKGKLILHGEIQKQLLEAMAEKHTRARRLDKKYIPDFLLHSPGDFNNQEIMMEVKSDPKLQFKQIHDDLKKIDQFISRYKYKMGIFLAINIGEANFKKKLQKHETRLWGAIEYTSKIHVIVSESPDKKVFHTLLCDIFK